VQKEQQNFQKMQQLLLQAKFNANVMKAQVH
jgi:hypothetical protein